jgi:hypothetical protein
VELQPGFVALNHTDPLLPARIDYLANVTASNGNEPPRTNAIYRTLASTNIGELEIPVEAKLDVDGDFDSSRNLPLKRHFHITVTNLLGPSSPIERPIVPKAGLVLFSDYRLSSDQALQIPQLTYLATNWLTVAEVKETDAYRAAALQILQARNATPRFGVLGAFLTISLLALFPVVYVWKRAKIQTQTKDI